MNRSEQYYAVYQQSLKNLQGPFPSLEDEMIVALWSSVQTLQTTVTQLSLKVSLLETTDLGENDSANSLLNQFMLGSMTAPVTKPTTEGEQQ